jgi:hypothetical protein
VSSRIFFAAAALASGYSIYLDQGIAWFAILTLAAVVVIILVRRHQRRQDEEYARLYGPHRAQPGPAQTPPPPRRE